jgi:N-acetyl-anhydromuramyl-L-alanine amidase AmpD
MKSRLFFCLSFVLSGVGGAQPQADLPAIIAAAASEFHVPPAVLKGIAFVESRWTNHQPATRDDDGTRMPPAFGAMGLRDDDWFGHSLTDGAALIGERREMVKTDLRANVRAAAALLAKIAAETIPAASPLESWVPVVARYCGIPQPEIRGIYAREIFTLLHNGYNDATIQIAAEPIDRDAVEAEIRALQSENLLEMPLGPDYGPAEWIPSPNFNSRGGMAVSHVIVHDTEGNYAGSLSWLTTTVSQVSSHYLLRSSDGHVAQLVRESDRAWHVRCWNSWTVGLEHEGYVNQPSYFTPQMYQSSAALVRDICRRHGIPMDRLHIVGHDVWQDPVLFPQLGWESCNDHTDPGQYWNWSYYIALIVADSTPPAVVAHVPAASATNVPIYKTIGFTFDRSMDILATEGAFSVDPSVAGKLSWSADGKSMTFDPTAYLESATSYTVTLTTAAKGSGGGALPEALQFTFTTAPLDTVGPRIVGSFPRGAMTDVNPFMNFQIRFDESVVYSSFAGRVRLVDAADTVHSLGVGSIVYTDLDAGALLTFAPTTALVLGHSYRLSFLPGIKDILGNGSSSETRIEFTAQTTADPQGTVFDPMESDLEQWQQPEASMLTHGIDTAGTSFVLTNTKKKGGITSGQLNYAFSGDSGGLCDLWALAGTMLQGTEGWFGMWVFGDNSGNSLEYLFASGGGNVTVVADTLDWFGWKFVSIPVSSLSGSGIVFHGIAIVQSVLAGRSGTIYFDDLQIEHSTDAAEQTARRPHAPFTLYQNYPNPFNPQTSIFFELERPERAMVTVYNILGQAVTKLLDKSMPAGRYRLEFNGTSDSGVPLPSGVYLCRLQTGAGSEQKKMLLVR